jgi:anti-sigma B factor antagonist
MDFNLSTTARLNGTGGLLLSVDGELDISTAEQLAKPAVTAVRYGRPLVLDLSECSFIDDAGLRFVLRMHNALNAVGKGMVVVTDSPHVRKLLSITAIDLSVRVFDQVDEAIAWLGADGTEAAPFPAPTAGGPSLSFLGP